MSSKIEKKDLKTIYRRYLALNSMNDYPGQMHNGYTFSLLPPHIHGIQILHIP